MDFIELCADFSNALKLLPDDTILRLKQDLQAEIFSRGYKKKKPEKEQVCVVGVHGDRNVFAIPEIRKHLVERFKYYYPLMYQDWKYLFNGLTLDENKIYYVYAHIKPYCGDLQLLKILRDRMDIPGVPFYIGKGTGSRAFDLKRNQGHGITIKRMISSGFSSESIVHILRDGLSELEALELESKLIYFFGTIYERKVKGVSTGTLYNLDIGRRPDFTREGKAFVFLKKKRYKKFVASNERKDAIIWYATSYRMAVTR